MATLLRCARWALVGLLPLTLGCAAMGAVAESFAEPGATDQVLTAPVDLTKGATREGAASGTSVYVVSPALTWTDLQFHRPHSLTGSVFNRTSLWSPECRRPPRGPFEVSGASGRGPSEHLARSGPAWLGAGGSVIRLDLTLMFDREAAADRALRSGALLAQQEPTCATSFDFYIDVALGSQGRPAPVHW